MKKIFVLIGLIIPLAGGGGAFIEAFNLPNWTGLILGAMMYFSLSQLDLMKNIFKGRSK